MGYLMPLRVGPRRWRNYRTVQDTAVVRGYAYEEISRLLFWSSYSGVRKFQLLYTCIVWTGTPRMDSRKLILATLFGAIVFAFETILPSPIDKAFVLFQALFLSLGYLLLGVPGATYVSMVGGLLTALWRAPLAPFTATFALLYGLLIDAISSIIKVRSVNSDVKVKRLIMAVTISTIVVGLASYYTSVIFRLLPRNPPLEIGILVAGIMNGVVGGYVSVIIWKRILKRNARMRIDRKKVKDVE